MADELVPEMQTSALSERSIVLLLAAVAFVIALSATVMFPLGPFVVVDIGGSPDVLGHLGAVYSLAAGFGGLAASFVLDRFDRRDALGIIVAAFTLATAASAAAPDIASLMMIRAFAGLCAGPIWACSSPSPPTWCLWNAGDAR